MILGESHYCEKGCTDCGNARVYPECCAFTNSVVSDYKNEALDRQRAAEDKAIAREKQRQRAVLDIRKKYGKNAIVRGMNLQEGATAMERSRQIGGHRA